MAMSKRKRKDGTVVDDYGFLKEIEQWLEYWKVERTA